MQDKFKIVTETALELFDAAEGDILDLDLKIRKQRPLNIMYDKICYQATQAAEKFIKGFIKYNNKEIHRTHDLIPSLEIAQKINKSFESIQQDCATLNNYGSKMRYSFHDTVKSHQVVDCIKALKNIYNFEPIKKIRKEFIQNGNYRISKDIKINEKSAFDLSDSVKSKKDVLKHNNLSNNMPTQPNTTCSRKR